VNSDQVRAAFDAQVRRASQADGPGARTEVAGAVVRHVAAGADGWSGITWSQLGEGDADTVIAGQIAYFRDLGREFEWKLYDYDQPPDLGRRLAAAGLAAEDQETLMISDITQQPPRIPPPAGVRLQRVTDEAGLAALIDVHERAFGRVSAGYRESLGTQLRAAPEATVLVVAMAGDEAVSAARMECLPGTDFASLWGGGTVPGWRRRGIYRALVAYRAQIAAARGYRYLYVDALPTSRPILSGLGFTALARTTPYQWRPAGQAQPGNSPSQVTAAQVTAPPR
jgi:ribosomal protein S18 acetylase RimI-like enzyme